MSNEDAIQHNMYL